MHIKIGRTLFHFLTVTSICFLSVHMYGDQKPVKDLTDPELGSLAFQAIGLDTYNSTRRCTACHRVSAELVMTWGARFTDIFNNCLLGKTIEALSELTQAEAFAAVNCLKANPTDPSSPYHPSRLGLMAGAADLLSVIFQKSEIANWEAEYRKFLNKARMPANRRASGFSAYDVAVLNEWIKRDYVQLDRTLVGVTPPQKVGCTTNISAELKKIIGDHSAYNWGTINKSRGVQNFACSPRKPSLNCFSMKDSNGKERFSLVQNIKRYKEINNASSLWNIRYITQMPYNSIFWTRSSADGQFTAAGATQFFADDVVPPNSEYPPSGAITDLMPLLKGEPPRVIPVYASFDPGFFADNSGFTFQGVTDNGKGLLKGEEQGDTVFCERKTLLDKNIKVIKGNTANCTTAELSLYHSTGVGLKGDDYLAIAGDFNGDAGDTDDEYNDDYTPPESELVFHNMLFDGQKYSQVSKSTEQFEYERDFIVSPAANLMTSRFFAYDPETQKLTQDGYNIRHLVKNTNADGVVSFSKQIVGRICTRGSKSPFSTSQRFTTFFRYVRNSDYKEFGFTSAEDTTFQEMVTEQTSNVYVYDLITQKTHRVTNMKAGDRAVFPHFRTDDWLVFLIKDKIIAGQDPREHLLTSDIALRILAGESIMGVQK